MSKLYKPGEIADRSGQYEMVGPRGRRMGIERTVVRNEPLPPPLSKGMRYILTDRTKHK